VLTTSLLIPAGQAAGKVNQPVKKSYPSVSVSFSPYPRMVHPIRIGISRRAAVTRFAVWAPGAIFVDNNPIFALNPQMVYTITNSSVIELGTNRSCALPVDRRSYISASDYRIWANNRWYRGVLEIINFGHSTTAINLLDLEEYLLGVVPSEMPASWHLEALKSQAVAARSYAWAHMGRGSKWYSSEGYELVPDVRDQAYKGLAAEAGSTFKAVQQTRGIVLKDSGRVKPGFYRATVGNAYENLNIRKQTVPESTLCKITGIPDIVGVTVKQWDPNGNALNIQVMGPKKSREVYGVALAKMLGFSTAGVLDVQEQGSNWVFTYRGPGNGSRGLSQHGANMLAAGGWRFDQILQQYYQDADGHLRLDYMDKYSAPVMPATAVISPTIETSTPQAKSRPSPEPSTPANDNLAPDAVSSSYDSPTDANQGAP
jgi:stage II sporulation protein D